MTNIKQNAGNNGVQVGSAGKISISGRGLGWWGCVAFCVAATVMGIAGIIVVFTFVAGDVVNTNTPLAMTAAAQPPIDPSNQYAWQEQPEVAPSNAGCPSAEDALWLYESDVWYGPITLDGIAYSIAYDAYNIYVYSSWEGLITYPDPAETQRRNQWLETGPFLVCVDDYGHVYVY